MLQAECSWAECELSPTFGKGDGQAETRAHFFMELHEIQKPGTWNSSKSCKCMCAYMCICGCVSCTSTDSCAHRLGRVSRESRFNALSSSQTWNDGTPTVELQKIPNYLKYEKNESVTLGSKNKETKWNSESAELIQIIYSTIAFLKSTAAFKPSF